MSKGPFKALPQFLLQLQPQIKLLLTRQLQRQLILKLQPPPKEGAEDPQDPESFLQPRLCQKDLLWLILTPYLFSVILSDHSSI